VVCPQCRKDAPEGSAYCNHCGASLNAAPAPAPAIPPPPPPAREPEAEVWRGGFSGRDMAGAWILYGTWFVLVAIAYFSWGIDSEWRLIGWIFGALLVGPVAYLGIVLAYEKLGTHYRLTTQRFFRSRGILIRTHDELELIRVDDVSVQQGIVDRIMGVGNVTLHVPTDQTTPVLVLRGIANPIEVKEMIRQQVRKMRERSIHMEQI
jgi:membrane protein YdbS with pleckstrin-like domain